MATLTLKRADTCRDCGRTLPAGARARWYPKLGTFCADKGECAARVFSVPASVQRRADDFAAGVDAARALLATVLRTGGAS